LNQRLPFIDGLRACAALLVLLTHTWVFAGAPALSFSIAGNVVVLAALPAIGHIGVNLFLVLSGFCLAWPLVVDPRRVTQISIASFWKRRVQRIVPAYFVSIGLVYGLLVVVRGLASAGLWPVSIGRVSQVPDVGELLPHLMFMHNLSVDHASTINGSYWSLALEFQLYLAFPLLFMLMHKCGWVRFFFGALTVQLCFRLYLEATLDAQVLAQFEFVLPKSMVGRMLDFVCGMAAATVVANDVRESRRTCRSIWVFVLAGSCLFGAFALSYAGYSRSSILDVLWAIGFASLVCYASVADSHINRVLSWKPLVSLGVMSYSLYLLHQPLVEIGMQIVRLHARPGMAFLIGLGLCPFIIGAGAIFYFLVEKKFLDHFLKRRKDSQRDVRISDSSPMTQAQTISATSS
jgi:peptidoglycan/LPS O-acetylase OafA/YrhL